MNLFMPLITVEHTWIGRIQINTHAGIPPIESIAGCWRLNGSEIRASNLSGDCKFMQEFMRGNIGIKAQHQKCVKRRATLSVAMNPNCPSMKVEWNLIFSDLSDVHNCLSCFRRQIGLSSVCGLCAMLIRRHLIVFRRLFGPCNSVWVDPLKQRKSQSHAIPIGLQNFALASLEMSSSDPTTEL